MVAVMGILAKSWGLRSSGNRGLEEGTRGQPAGEPVALLVCPDLSPSSSAQQPGSFSPAAPSSGCGPAFPCCPHPALPGFPVAHLQLPLLEDQLLMPTKSLVWVISPKLLLPSPTAPLASFGVACSPHHKQDFVFSCQLVSKLGPLGVLLSLQQQLCISLACPAVLVLSHRGHVVCDNK